MAETNPETQEHRAETFPTAESDVKENEDPGKDGSSSVSVETSEKADEEGSKEARGEEEQEAEKAGEAEEEELLPFVKDLVGMGFQENESAWAVHLTGGASLDAAVTWILNHKDDPILETPFDPSLLLGPPAWTPDSPHKMVLVVRMDLGMGRGKVAAQCAHAALGGYVRLVETGQTGRPKLRCWFPVGQTKIVVRCNSLEELEELEAKAQSADIPTFVVHDAGRTQIAAGSATVLAVGPDTQERVDWVTGNQKLL